MKSLLSLALFFTVSASAQTAIPMEFPSDSVPLSTPALTEKLSGKVFSAKMADGRDWRYQFKGDYFYFNVSTGHNDSGTWRIEGSSLCLNLKRSAASCSELRVVGDVLLIKRASNGEVATLVPR